MNVTNQFLLLYAISVPVQEQTFLDVLNSLLSVSKFTVASGVSINLHRWLLQTIEAVRAQSKKLYSFYLVRRP